MARSRNIKPSFFTNDDLAEVHPLGRLLFIALWTMADREGRLEDRPKRIKAEALPYDDCDADALLSELAARKFIVRYGHGGHRFIQISTFSKHQNPHVKEAPSVIPPPTEGDTEPVKHGSSTVPAQCDAQPQPEQAGLIPDSGFLIPDSPSLIPDSPIRIPDRERSPPKPDRSPTGSRIPDGFPDDDAIDWCRQERADLDAERVAATFRDHWIAVPGARGRKLDWGATWRNWVRGEKRQHGPPPRASPQPSRYAATIAALTGRSDPQPEDVIDVDSRTVSSTAAAIATRDG